MKRVADGCYRLPASADASRLCLTTAREIIISARRRIEQSDAALREFLATPPLSATAHFWRQQLLHAAGGRLNETATLIRMLQEWSTEVASVARERAARNRDLVQQSRTLCVRVHVSLHVRERPRRVRRVS